MATSAAGTMNGHDFKRVGELMMQGFLALFLSNLATVLPMMEWGKYDSVKVILIMIVTEAAKRYVQSPTQAPLVPPAV